MRNGMPSDPQVLELLLEQGFSASILTKSDLVLRDLDLLLPMEDSAVSFSVAFNGDDVRQLFEANTKTTEARISALKKLRAAGIRTTALICPLCRTFLLLFAPKLFRAFENMRCKGEVR